MKTIRLIVLIALINGCANKYENTAIGLTIAGSMPINEIEQTYYLGVFDPLEQVPPQIYRIRVHGQSSLMGGKFASGWVPAEVVDTLNLTDLNSSKSSLGLGTSANQPILDGRKLVAFGPEGFRHIPKNHRLVMVMGGDASDFFRAVSGALGSISKTKIELNDIQLTKEVFKELSSLLMEKQRLFDFKNSISGEN